MKIQKSYFKDWDAGIKQLKKEVQDERNSLTNEELCDERKEIEKGLEELHKRIAEMEARTIYIKLPHQKLLFKYLTCIALRYAKEDCADIEVDTTEDRGRIRLEIGQVIVDDLRIQHRSVWTKLIRHANTYWVNAVDRNGESILQFTFFYNFKAEFVWKGFRK